MTSRRRTSRQRLKSEAADIRVIKSKFSNLDIEGKNRFKEFYSDFLSQRQIRITALEEDIENQERLIRNHFQKLLIQLPIHVQNLTIGQILEEGGDIDFSGTIGHEIGSLKIPKSLVLSKELGDGDKSLQIFQEVQKSVRKKVPKTVAKMLPPQSSRVLRSTARLMTGTQGRTIQRIKDKSESGSSGFSTDSEKTPRNNQPNCTMDVINAKTPTVELTLMPLKKAPRRPKPNEDIIICSKSGTPLVIDESWLKKQVRQCANKENATKSE